MTQYETKTALVTGANRGLGLETCRQLAQRGLQVILSCRDESKGHVAVEQLKNEGLEAALCVLDVTKDTDVTAAKAFIAENFGHLDVLVNNAGVFLDGEADNPVSSSIMNIPIDVLRETMETNLYGALRLCQAFVPGMKERNYGRVVNLSSGMGQLSDMNGCCPGYRTSKVALNALTRIFSDELRGTNVLVNSLCPGWVRTDMGGPHANRNVDEGADTIVWLATLPDNGPSGGFFRDRKPIPW